MTGSSRIPARPIAPPARHVAASEALSSSADVDPAVAGALIGALDLTAAAILAVAGITEEDARSVLAELWAAPRTW